MQESYEPFIEDLRADSAFVHESSFVDAPCRIGEHTSIMHFSRVMQHSIIGDHCFIGHNVTIGSGNILGNSVRVMHNSLLNSGVILETDVYCGPSTIFAENRHVRANSRNMSRVSPTLVRQGAQIGPNTTIASGHTIGQYSFSEAGTVIDSNIPDFAIVYGNPLKFAGWRCQCGQSLITGAKSRTVEKLHCSYCNRRYVRQAEWKIVLLSEEASTLDSHSEPDPSIRTAEGPD